MKRFILFFSFNLFIIQAVKSQNTFEQIDQDSTETKEENTEFTISFLEDLAFETAADIGSGNLELILQIANHFPEKHFWLEDVDSSFCNYKKMRQKISELELNNINPKNLKIQIGDEDSTWLPSNYFDVVFVFNLLHEIDNKPDFMQELERILKPYGSIIIADSFYKIKPAKHHGCHNPFLTEIEFDEFLKTQNFQIEKDWKRLNIKDGKSRNYMPRIVQVSINKN